MGWACCRHENRAGEGRPWRIDASILRYLARLIRPFPDFDFFFVKHLRARAVEKLRLRPGDRVLDLGCGPGASFPYLHESVTESGVVVGVEISPEFQETSTA